MPQRKRCPHRKPSTTTWQNEMLSGWVRFTSSGLTVGVVLNDMKPEERRRAYGCDITYVTNNELGFDYLRDNMVIYKEQLVQRDLHYCIIDEIDSVLIDEARTPLIISDRAQQVPTSFMPRCAISLHSSWSVVRPAMRR